MHDRKFLWKHTGLCQVCGKSTKLLVHEKCGAKKAKENKESGLVRPRRAKKKLSMTILLSRYWQNCDFFSTRAAPGGAARFIFNTFNMTSGGGLWSGRLCFVMSEAN